MKIQHNIIRENSEPPVSQIAIKLALETISKAIKQRFNRSDQLKACDALWDLRCVFDEG